MQIYVFKNYEQTNQSSYNLGFLKDKWMEQKMKAVLYRIHRIETNYNPS